MFIFVLRYCVDSSHGRYSAHVDQGAGVDIAHMLTVRHKQKSRPKAAMVLNLIVTNASYSYHSTEYTLLFKIKIEIDMTIAIF